MLVVYANIMKIEGLRTFPPSLKRRPWNQTRVWLNGREVTTSTYAYLYVLGLGVLWRFKEPVTLDRDHYPITHVSVGRVQLEIPEESP